MPSPIKNHPIITSINGSCKNPDSSIVEPSNLNEIKQTIPSSSSNNNKGANLNIFSVCVIMLSSC